MGREGEINSRNVDPWQAQDVLILAEGMSFVPRDLPKGMGYRRGKKKQCFQNCFFKACDHDLIYVEGYVLVAGAIPIHHAWCTDKFGFVYEFTLSEPGIAYFGIPFKTEVARKYLGLAQDPGWFGNLVVEIVARATFSIEHSKYPDAILNTKPLNALLGENTAKVRYP
jgi:hypothetical protein